MPGESVIWLGSPKGFSYAQRDVPAKIIRIFNDRVQIEIETPSGKIKKCVSPNSLELPKKDTCNSFR